MSKADIHASATIRTGALFLMASYACVIYLIEQMRRHKCPCLDDWRDDFCYYYSMVAIAMQSVTFVLGNRKWYQPYVHLVGVLSMVNMIVLASYLHRLQFEEGCQCGSMSKSDAELQLAVRFISYLWTIMFVATFVYMVIAYFTYTFSS